MNRKEYIIDYIESAFKNEYKLTNKEKDTLWKKGETFDFGCLVIPVGRRIHKLYRRHP